MKKITIGLALAALVTGVVVFSSFTILDNETSKQNVSSSQTGATDPLYFRYIGPDNDAENFEDPTLWVFEGDINPGNGCSGGEVACRVVLEPADNPGISDSENPTVAAILFADYLASQDGTGSYESSIDFVMTHVLSKKP
ncbi:MAG: hypothetical protein NVV59_08180 [Chitinophagaceae bacterium]|nr:hypothetical protein [Chitinophagaceae bacterium]